MSHLSCDFAEWKIKLNSSRGPFIIVVVIFHILCQIFSQLSMRKIQALIAWNSTIKWVNAFAVSFSHSGGDKL